MEKEEKSRPKEMRKLRLIKEIRLKLESKGFLCEK
jgi:hypothetical protein